MIAGRPLTLEQATALQRQALEAVAKAHAEIKAAKAALQYWEPILEPLAPGMTLAPTAFDGFGPVRVRTYPAEERGLMSSPDQALQRPAPE